MSDRIGESNIAVAQMSESANCKKLSNSHGRLTKKSYFKKLSLYLRGVIPNCFLNSAIK